MRRRRTPLVLLPVLLGMGACAAALPAQDPTSMSRAVFTDGDGGKLPYRLGRPKSPGKGPRFLILFLHGAGERGEDNRSQLRHGVRELLQVCAQHHGLLLAPQCPKGAYWPQPALRRQVAALLQEVLAEHQIDRQRIYLTGLSMGGMGTWELAMDHPDWFAAALPICGRGDPRRAARLSQMPVWAFHGDADRAVKVSGSRRMVAAMKRSGGAPKYREYPGVGHNSWTRTYGDEQVLAWLIAQRRKTYKPLDKGGKLVFFGDSITAAGARKGGYIRRLEAAWQEAMPQRKIAFVGAGISGHKVPQLLARLDRDVLKQQPSWVMIYIGTNDVWHQIRKRGTPLRIYQAGLEALIDRIRKAGAEVLLCTPAVIGELPRGKNPLDPDLDRYSAAVRQIARQKGCPLLDLREIFFARIRAAKGKPARQGVLTSDGVHLNARGNQLLADELLALLRRLPH